MKFSSVLFFTALVSAAPTIETRQQTVAGTIFDNVNTLETATRANFVQIRNVIDTAADSTAAQVEASIRANYGAILAAFQTATQNIVAVTTGAAGGVAGSVQGLTQAQLIQFIEAIRGAQRILEGLGATIELTVTNLEPDIRNAVQAEIDAVKAVITPFVTPLNAFADAARRASATLNLSIFGLNNAQTEFNRIYQNLIRSLGLPAAK